MSQEAKKTLIARNQGSGVAGGISPVMRTTDWYGDSEHVETVLHDEYHMCYIPTSDALCRQVYIAANPDPLDKFGAKLTGHYRALSNLGSSGSPDIYKNVEVRMYLDRSKMAIVVNSFSPDGKIAYCNSPVIGAYAEGSFMVPDDDTSAEAEELRQEYRESMHFEAQRDEQGKAVLDSDGKEVLIPVLYYRCWFAVVAVRSNPYPPMVGAATLYRDVAAAAQLDENAFAQKYRASVVIKHTFIKDLFGNYPEKAYLRVLKKAVDGQREFWLDYLPLNPIKSLSENPEEAQFGKVTFHLDDLEPGTEYDVFVVEPVAVASDSSSIKDRKSKLLHMLGDSALYTMLRTYNRGNLEGNGSQARAMFDALTERQLADSTTPGPSADEIKATQVAFWSANVLEQSFRVTRFKTPTAPNDTKKQISYFAGSCFGGTLDGMKGMPNIPHDFMVLLGDKFYNDNVRGAFEDFMANYEAFLKNESAARAFASSCLYTLSDDHENADNWFRNIFISRFNSDKVILTADEKAIYDKMMAIPAIRAMIVSRLTNQFPMPLSPLARIEAAAKANDMFWPNAPSRIDALDKASNGSFRVRYGAMNVILLNSNPEVDANGSVKYSAVEGTWTPGATPAQDTFTKPPGETRYNFIPETSVAFLKRILSETGKDAATCHSVFFSSDVACMFKNYYAVLKKQNMAGAIAAIRATDPNAEIPTATINSMYDKKFAAAEYDNADNYAAQVLGLVNWIKEKGITNVFFHTGDPHSSLIKYMDKENVIVSVCTSSVSTYRASGYNLMLATNLDAEDTILALSGNSYAHLTFDPVAKTMNVALRYAEEVRGEAVIPLSKKKPSLKQEVSAATPSSGSGWLGRFAPF